MNDQIKPRKYYTEEWKVALRESEFNKVIDSIWAGEQNVDIGYTLPLPCKPGQWRFIPFKFILNAFFPPDHPEFGLAHHLEHMRAIFAEHEKDQARLVEISNDVHYVGKDGEHHIYTPNNED